MGANTRKEEEEEEEEEDGLYLRTQTRKGGGTESSPTIAVQSACDLARNRPLPPATARNGRTEAK